MNKVLCLTDFSVSSQKATQYAAWVAHRCSAGLTLLHAAELHLLQNEEEVSMHPQTIVAQMHMAERTLHDTCAQLREKYNTDAAKPLQCDFMVKEGLLSEIVERVCKDSAYDFIILGTTSSEKAVGKELIIGSNTVKVLETVTCPVLTIPEDCTVFHLEKIIVATNLDQKDAEAIKQIIDFATCFNAQIYIVNVCTQESNENRNSFEEFCRPLAQQIEYDKIHFNQISHNDVENGILNFAQQTHANLITLFADKNGSMSRFFHQSVTEQQSYHSKIPFLVLHHLPEA